MKTTHGKSTAPAIIFFAVVMVAGFWSVASSGVPALFPEVDVPGMETHNNLDTRYKNTSTSLSARIGQGQSSAGLGEERFGNLSTSNSAQHAGFASHSYVDVRLAGVLGGGASMYINYSSGPASMGGVRWGAGSDETGDGTPDKPYRTFAKAWAMTPPVSAGDYDYRFAPGTFHESINVIGKAASGGYGFNLYGCMTTVDSGTTTGGNRNTFPNGTTIVNDTAKSWSAGQHNQRFVNISTPSGWEWRSVRGTLATALHVRGRFTAVPAPGARYFIKSPRTTLTSDGNGTTLTLGFGQKNVHIYGFRLSGGQAYEIWGDPGCAGSVEYNTLDHAGHIGVSFNGAGGLLYNANVHIAGNYDGNNAAGQFDVTNNFLRRPWFENTCTDWDSVRSVQYNEIDVAAYYQLTGNAFRQQIGYNLFNGGSSGLLLFTNSAAKVTNNKFYDCTKAIESVTGTVQFKGGDRIYLPDAGDTGLVFSTNSNGISTSNITFSGAGTAKSFDGTSVDTTP